MILWSASYQVNDLFPIHVFMWNSIISHAFKVVSTGSSLNRPLVLVNVGVDGDGRDLEDISVAVINTELIVSLLSMQTHDNLEHLAMMEAVLGTFYQRDMENKVFLAQPA